MGCEDERARQSQADWNKFKEDIGNLASLPFSAVKLPFSAVKYAIDNVKYKKELKEKHSEIIAGHKSNIDESIFDLQKKLNELYHLWKEKPKAPNGAPLSPFLIFVSVIVSLVLIATGLWFFIVPIVALVGVVIYSENQPAKKEAIQKYNLERYNYEKDYKEFKIKIDSFVNEQIEPLRTKAEKTVKLFEKWYKFNGYTDQTTILQFNCPSNWVLKTFSGKHVCSWNYYNQKEPQPSLGHEIWNPKD